MAEKMNITLRVDKDLVGMLKAKKIVLSEFFNDAARILIFKERAYINIATKDLEFVKSEKAE